MVGSKRHIAKAITYRLLSSAITFVVAWLFTKQLSVGVTIVLFDVFVKLVIYYLHERVWYRFIRYGIKNIREQNKK